MKRTMSRGRGLRTLFPKRKGSHKKVHGSLVALFAIAAFLLVLLNVAVILTPSVHPALAAASDNFTGWAWSDTGGWLSMNNTNPSAGGGTYGVTMNLGTRAVTGCGWSDSQGWICFGSSVASICGIATNTPAGSASAASMDSSGNLHGWAMICNLGAPDGWTSLNCADTSPSSCGTSNYVPVMSTVSGWFTGFAWNAVGSGTGWGWIDFSGAGVGNRGVRGPHEQDITSCHDATDNDADGQTDCADNGCYQQTGYSCPAQETQCALLGRSNCCGNNLDDDNDGLMDCADVADCGTDPACLPEICNNGIDDNGKNGIDCADPTCSGYPACTPAWIRSNFGSIYSQQGVGGNAPPPGQNNATYCITSAGTISNFVSQTGCTEAASVPINLPNGGNGYVSNIGRLDLPGITSGRYGTVKAITTDAGIDQPLAGKVYLYDRDANGGTCPSAGPNGANTAFILSGKTFNNASGSTGRGSGLLVIKGCDLVVSANSSYQATGVSTYLRNLASFGVVVASKYVGGVPTYGGNIYINSAVTQVVGLYFGERSIHTGSVGNTYPTPSTDARLQIYGALVSRNLQLERRYGDTTNPAEEVIFDGRGVVNPPPGLQDITKSLPALKDAF